MVGRRVTATSDPAQGKVLEVIIWPILLAMIYLIEPEHRVFDFGTGPDAAA